MRSLIASIQDPQDPQASRRLPVRSVAPLVCIVQRILQRAAKAVEIARMPIWPTAVVAVHGAFWYRLLLGETLDDSYAGKLAALVLASLRS